MNGIRTPPPPTRMPPYLLQRQLYSVTSKGILPSMGHVSSLSWNLTICSV